MNNKIYPRYWNFAINVAIDRLRVLVYHFDIGKETRHNDARYVGLKPSWIIEMIESILEEREKLDNPKITQLQRMLEYTRQIIVSQHQLGEDKAELYWSIADNEEKQRYISYDVDKYWDIAKSYAPNSTTPTEINWFVEGFSVRWSENWTRYMRKNTDRSND